MGVDLRGLVKPTKISLDRLSGQTVAIDAYNALYQFLSIIRGETGEHLTDSEGRVTSHLSGLLYRNINFLVLGIKPVYVLDGKPPTLKTIEIERRRAAKHEAVAKYMNAISRGDKVEAKKYAQATSMIKDYMLDDAKKILNLLGIPTVEAPSEGEATAAYFTSSGVTAVTASQDFDSLLFGATKLVRNLAISGRRKLPGKRVYINVDPEEIELNKLLTDQGITREQPVDIGILVGTDFNPDGYKGIGPARALKFIKEYGRIEDIPNTNEESKRINYESIREIFLHPKVAELERVEWGTPDPEGIIRFLCEERSFSETRVRNALSKLEEVERNRSESLERWFS